MKSKAPPQFKPQVLDTEKRLNILFDHLNNEDLLRPDTIEEMNSLAQALRLRNHEEAQAMFTDIMTNRTEEGSNWMVRQTALIVYWIGQFDIAFAAILSTISERPEEEDDDD